MEAEDISFDGGEAPGAKLGINAKPKRSRKRSILIFTVVSLINVGLLALLWSQLLTPAHPNTTATTSDGPTSSNPLVGHPAPNFTLSTLSGAAGSSLSLTHYKGSVVMLNFWGSTCGPCQDEAPFMQSQWQHVHTQGVVFLGVDYQDTKTDGLIFVHQYHITYPNVVDATGSTAIDYGVTGTPETFFINRQGNVIAWVWGPLTTQTFQHNLQLAMR